MVFAEESHCGVVAAGEDGAGGVEGDDGLPKVVEANDQQAVEPDDAHRQRLRHQRHARDLSIGMQRLDMNQSIVGRKAPQQGCQGLVRSRRGR